MSELDVPAKVLVERGSGELEHRLRDVLSRRFDRNVIVLLEVDTGVLLCGVLGVAAEQLTLNTRVGRAGNVLAIFPLAISRTAGSVTTAAATTGVTTLVAAAIASATTPAATTTTSSARWERATVTLEVDVLAVVPVVLTSSVVLAVGRKWSAA